MKHLPINRAVVFLAIGAISAGAFAAEGPSASAPLSSTKDRGVVSLVTDPVLSQGRLVLKVVAFNRTRGPAAFDVSDVQIETVAGKPVAIVPLDQLIAEVTKASGSQPRKTVSTDHNPSDYSHPAVSAGAGGAGEPDLGGYTGAANPTSGVVSSHTQVSADGPAATGNPAQNEAVASLKAGILQSMIIPSASAAGGQVVTEKLKFARKEEKALRVRVDFNGEQHEFTVPVPSK